MAPSEYENLADKIDDGFKGVHARIDTFKDEFHNHRLVCVKLFEEIHTDEATRKGAEKEIDRQLKKNIDWGKVRTAVSIAVASLLTLAAVKIIFTNIGKFTW